MTLTDKQLDMLTRNAERYQLRMVVADDKSSVLFYDTSGNLSISFDGTAFRFPDGQEAGDVLQRMGRLVTGVKMGLALDKNLTPLMEGLAKLAEEQKKKQQK
jgi:hypothetical protein